MYFRVSPNSFVSALDEASVLASGIQPSFFTIEFSGLLIFKRTSSFDVFLISQTSNSYIQLALASIRFCRGES